MALYGGDLFRGILGTKEWINEIFPDDSVNTPMVILVCGGPGTFKSSFTLTDMVRYLIKYRNEWGVYFTFEQTVESLKTSFRKITGIDLDKIKNLVMIDIARGRQTKEMEVVRRLWDEIADIDAKIEEVKGKLAEFVKLEPKKEKKEELPPRIRELLETIDKIQGKPAEKEKKVPSKAEAYVIDVTKAAGIPEEHIKGIRKLMRGAVVDMEQRAPKIEKELEDKIEKFLDELEEKYEKGEIKAREKKAKEKKIKTFLNQINIYLKVEREAKIKDTKRDLKAETFHWIGRIHEVIAELKMSKKNVTLIGVDSLGALYPACGLKKGDEKIRNLIHKFFHELREVGVRAFLVAEIEWELVGGKPRLIELYAGEGFLCDVIIGLGLEIEKGKRTRYMQVLKHRFCKHSHSQYVIKPFKNEHKGIAVVASYFKRKEKS